MKTETTICNKLVSCALAAGYAVTVYDGEEFALRNSKDRAAIKAAMFSTDCDRLYFWNGRDMVGSVLLIYGNGQDVISDHSDNAAINALVNSVTGQGDSVPSSKYVASPYSFDRD